MSSKISVITVVYNDAGHIRETMESFFAQTWEEKEYIVIDGGSTDGTKDIVSAFGDRLAFWCSEPDGGIYDAMNKGISHVTGDWVCFLNSGDSFASDDALRLAVTSPAAETADVVYGNSIEVNDGFEVSVEAPADPTAMEMRPIYRHGSSLVRASVQKSHPFDTSLSGRLGFALDWEMIYRLFKEGFRFAKADAYIQAYQREGTSNEARLSMRYNYLITSQGKFNLRKYVFYQKTRLMVALQGTSMVKWMRAFALEYLPNDILPHIPFWTIRRYVLRKLKLQIGKQSFIMKSNYFISPNRLRIGDYSHINRGCLLDARGIITIGDNVSVSHNVSIMTGGHDMQSPTFSGRYLPIVISDYVWIGVGATILQGVTIGRGAVVCAGAVVTKDVEEYAVVAGVPARKISERNRDLRYHCIWDMPFT